MKDMFDLDRDDDGNNNVKASKGKFIILASLWLVVSATLLGVPRYMIETAPEVVVEIFQVSVFFIVPFLSVRHPLFCSIWGTAIFWSILFTWITTPQCPPNFPVDIVRYLIELSGS